MSPSAPRFSPVPVLHQELLWQVRTPELRLSESWHRASSRIGRHAHRHATVTILLGGSFEEGYGL
jgi:hypothetical protein